MIYNYIEPFPKVHISENIILFIMDTIVSVIYNFSRKNYKKLESGYDSLPIVSLQIHQFVQTTLIRSK